MAVITRKAGRVMGTGLVVIVVCILILLGALLALSSGTPRPILDEHRQPVQGSVSEKISVKINGVEQGMFIQGRDASKPVLLFVHGGPGMPEYWLTERYPTGLEDDFVVVWWEQRGSGLSYSPDLPPETMTVDQMVADTIEVSRYLVRRFHQDKIYLMGHSGGSFYAIQAAQRVPELYHAYIGMAQMANQLKSEQIAYDYMLAEYSSIGDEKMAKKLAAAPRPETIPLPPAYDALRDEAMHRLGVGTTRDMKSVISEVFFPSWLSRDYTLPEKLNLWRGKFFSMRMLRNTIFATDLTQQVTRLDVPVYFLHGAHDYTCSYELAKDYLTRIEAPVKGFYTFNSSAHTPLFEEPGEVRKVLSEDVLAGTAALADDLEE